MTAQWNPEWPVDARQVNQAEDKLRKIQELRDMCNNAPMDLGFLVRRLKAIGATVIAAELAEYAEALKNKSVAAS
jgi:hypothetical protein